ncbi:hypothetical protein [Sphingobium sp. HWE2-09]|uniref:hypothetical protein n=1 Tax=Sphingobium sp. HWE2-09 TaxID=3108390 RepID=UPI002DCC066F|nr:hypothetical protein [Sphingobium sp. HWE2-09]
MANSVEHSSVDLERYRALVAGIDLSQASKDEVIRIISRMMGAFVDQAFGVDPTHLSMKLRQYDSFHADSEHAILPTIPDDDVNTKTNGSGIGEMRP